MMATTKYTFIITQLAVGQGVKGKMRVDAVTFILYMCWIGSQLQRSQVLGLQYVYCAVNQILLIKIYLNNVLHSIKIVFVRSIHKIWPQPKPKSHIQPQTRQK